MSTFKFDLGQQVALAISGEKGSVTGRAEYLADEYSNQYRVEYLMTDGRACDGWFSERQLAARNKDIPEVAA